MYEVSIRNRNDCFDFLKGIACIAVVFMHCEFPGGGNVCSMYITLECTVILFYIRIFFSKR